MNTDDVHFVGLGKVHGVVGVLHHLEPREFLTLFGLGNPTPDDGAGDDLVKALQEDGSILRQHSSDDQVGRTVGHAAKHTYLEILEQVVYSWVDIQAVQPQCEDTCFPLSLRIKVFNLRWCLGLVQRVKTRMGVEEMGDKGQVQLWIARYERVRS